MNVESLFNRAQVRGVRLALNGDKVTIRGPSEAVAAITPEVVAHKLELLDYLRMAANDSTGASGYPVADGPFTPYCVPLPRDAVAAMQAELVSLIDRLADGESLHEDRRTKLVQTVHRQPLSSLRGDLAHFRARWDAHEAVQRASEVGRQVIAEREANRKCSTCQHRTLHESSVPVRCARGRMLGIQHHEWLDAPDMLNPCREHTPKRSVSDEEEGSN